MTDTCPATRAAVFPAGPTEHLRRLIRTILRAPQVAAERRALAALDDHLLRDIGLTPGQASHEAARPGWDAPRHWRD